VAILADLADLADLAELVASFESVSGEPLGTQAFAYINFLIFLNLDLY